MATKAIAYLRTSSITNVGGDSDVRQRQAIHGYAKANDIEVVQEFYDAGVTGTLTVQDRPQFSAMLDRIEGNGVRMVIVEDAGRFARDIMVQEAGLAMLVSRGVKVLTASGDDLTDTDDPMRKMMRVIIGAVMEAEKSRLVAKLRAARDRKSAAVGRRIEGPAGAPEPARTMAKALREEGLTLRAIAERLAQAGFLSPSGKVYGPESVKAMI